MKVVFNDCFGGFSLSERALKRLKELNPSMSGLPAGMARHDSMLVRVVEELRGDASGECSDIGIAEVTGDRYWIQEYDGWETVWTPETIEWVVV